MKKVLVIIVSLFLLLPNVYAKEDSNYGVTQHEQQLIDREKKDNKNLFEDLKYRFLEKDTRDNYDYLILSFLILSMLIIIVIKNKKVSEPIEESVFEN